MDRKEYNRQWHLKETSKEKKRQYYLKNKEKIKEKNRLYRKTPQGIKYDTIYNWKTKGLIGDPDAIYEIYLATTECMRCSIQLSEGNKKCMDHDHVTGLYRAILCNSCNSGNFLDLHCRKHNKIGIKNITKTKKGYRFEKTTNGVAHNKHFKTLEEAVKYKEQYLSELGQRLDVLVKDFD